MPVIVAVFCLRRGQTSVGRRAVDLAVLVGRPSCPAMGMLLGTTWALRRSGAMPP